MNKVKKLTRAVEYECKAIINTEVAVNKVGIIKTPNHPM